MSDQNPKQATGGQGQRIEQLEHAAGYAERHIDLLSGEVAEINKAMSEMQTRLNRLESRLVDLHERVNDDPGNVPPPHSAGPDVPREPL